MHGETTKEKPKPIDAKWMLMIFYKTKTEVSNRQTNYGSVAQLYAEHCIYKTTIIKILQHLMA